jgi:alpha-L-rhamnosidase
MIDNGATTIWETWKESDNTYSNCHPMFGTVTEWYYRWLGGIKPDPENPGFKEFFITPSVPNGLQYVNCSYSSPFGEITSNWKKQGNGSCVYEIKVPPETHANVSLSVDESQKIIMEIHDENIAQELPSGEFQLEEGHYRITVSTKS